MCGTPYASSFSRSGVFVQPSPACTACRAGSRNEPPSPLLSADRGGNPSAIVSTSGTVVRLGFRLEFGSESGRRCSAIIAAASPA